MNAPDLASVNIDDRRVFSWKGNFSELFQVASTLLAVPIMAACWSIDIQFIRLCAAGSVVVAAADE